MHPILIVGAALAGLPILLHLIMKQEPKRLLFPAVRFLKLKQKTNQRKMRLRHLLLLLLRLLLIALFAVTLWQPKLEGSALNLSDDQPVAAVLVIDNSPSMGYTVNGVTRFDDARRRAVEFLDELPSGSKVAVLDANDTHGDWEPTVGDAKRKIEGMKEPAGFGQPITTVLPTAYQLFASADEEGTDPENRLPRVLAVFGDRASGSWDGNRVEELKKARDGPPPTAGQPAGQPAAPPVVHLFFDVGTDTAVNVSVAAVDMRPQLIPAAAEAVLTVTLKADGAAVPEAEVTCALDDAAKPDRKVVAVPAGGQQAVTFNYRNLKPGFHTATVRIRDDNLAADNVRSFTFAVADRRKILTIADDPENVRLWRLSHNVGKQEFDCTVAKPGEVTAFDGYEAVCLISVAKPGKLWKDLKGYAEAGGKVFVAPPGFGDIDRADYEAGGIEVLPAKLKQERKDWRTEPKAATGPDRTRGVTWAIAEDRDLLHPFLAPFRDWKKRGNVDVIRDPRRAWRYWEVEKLPGAATVANFDDADDPTQRSPALVERVIGKGKVLLLTTRLDDDPEKEADKWNDYWAFNNSWPTVFPNVVARYLVGSPEDAVFNFPTGQDVRVPLPRPEGDKPRVILLEGPGVIGRDARPEVGANQTDLTVPRAVTLTAGEYTVRTEDRKWEQRFSLTVPAEESVLDKVPEEAIAGLFGKDAVLPVGKSANLKALISTRAGQPVPLFPWLLILVLVLFALEGLFANRFYRAKAG